MRIQSEGFSSGFEGILHLPPMLHTDIIKNILFIMQLLHPFHPLETMALSLCLGIALISGNIDKSFFNPSRNNFEVLEQLRPILNYFRFDLMI